MKTAFDLRAAITARHAQHVILIHFPIALLIAAVIFDYLARWKKDAAFAAASYWNLVLAAISTVPVLATGLLAWQWALEGQKLKGVLLLHLLLGCLSAAFIWLLLLLHRRSRRSPQQPASNFRLVVEALAILVVALTAHLGGFLSGVNAPS